MEISRRGVGTSALCQAILQLSALLVPPQLHLALP